MTDDRYLAGRFGGVTGCEDNEGRVLSFLAHYSYRGEYVWAMFPSRDKADAWLARERRSIELDTTGETPWRRPEASSTCDAGMLFADYATLWVRARCSDETRPMRGRSMLTLHAQLTNLIKGFPPPLRLKDIDRRQIDDWYRHRHPAGGNMFRRCCELLRAMLRDASDPDRDGGPLIDGNPYRLPLPRLDEPASHAAPPATPEQLKGLYEAFPEYTRLSVLLSALVGGLRISEVCALKVGDIDLDRRTLTVGRAATRDDHGLGRVRVGPTKTKGSRRTVTIPDRIIPIIRRHLAAHCSDDPDAFLFPSRNDKTTFVSPRTLTTQMQTARVKVGRPDLTFHMLRASHATMYMVEGGTLREAMDQLGHTTERVAIRHYQRIVPDHRRGISDRLADMMLADLLGTGPVSGTDLPDELRRLLDIDPSEPVTFERLEEILTDMRDRLARLERLFAQLPEPPAPPAGD